MSTEGNRIMASSPARRPGPAPTLAFLLALASLAFLTPACTSASPGETTAADPETASPGADGRTSGGGNAAPGEAAAGPPARLGEPARLPSPAGPEAGEPNLRVGPDGRVYLSWIESTGPEHALRFAALDPAIPEHGWSDPRTIAVSDRFFVNWADFPSLVVLEDGTLVAHWLQREGEGYAYGVRLSRSADGGVTWSEPVTPHHDGTLTEHGFVSLVAEPGGGFTAVWLDGRDFAGAEPTPGGHGPPDAEMSLRASRFAADGTQGPVNLLDPRICDCCQTSAARVGDELLVVYRDRSPEEIRDIWAVTRGPDGWREPVRLARDDWQIPGCPVNGPSVAARGEVAAVAWFSLRKGRPEVKLTFTDDAGRTFSEPILVHRGGPVDGSAGPAEAGGAAPGTGTDTPEDGEAPAAVDHRGPGSRADDTFVPLGRVDVAWLDDQSVAVSWLAGDGGDGEVRILPSSVSGVAGDATVVATTRASRASGFPQIVVAGDRLVVAWTDPGGRESPPRVLTATLPVVDAVAEPAGGSPSR